MNIYLKKARKLFIDDTVLVVQTLALIAIISGLCVTKILPALVCAGSLLIGVALVLGSSIGRAAQPTASIDKKR